ncbi:hypothetical protein D3C86_1480810 [compost metagenome]
MIIQNWSCQNPASGLIHKKVWENVCVIGIPFISIIIFVRIISAEVISHGRFRIQLRIESIFEDRKRTRIISIVIRNQTSRFGCRIWEIVLETSRNSTFQTPIRTFYQMNQTRRMCYQPQIH